MLGSEKSVTKTEQSGQQVGGEGDIRLEQLPFDFHSPPAEIFATYIASDQWNHECVSPNLNRICYHTSTSPTITPWPS